MNNVRVSNLDGTFVPVAGATGVELTVANSVVQVPDSTVQDWLSKRVQRVELSVKAQPAHYTLDNSNPVASGAGSYLAVGLHVWSLDKVRAAKFIRAGGSDSMIRFEPGA